MRRILKYLIIAFLAYSCGSNGNIGKSKGELVGIKGKKYFAEKPYGMVLVPGGSYIMGKSDDDMPAIQDAPTKPFRKVFQQNISYPLFQLTHL